MEVLNGIDGMALGVIIIFMAGFLYSLWLIVNAQGDLLVDDTVNTIRGGNDDQKATGMFLDLIKATRKSIVIHDDGDNSPRSVYNNPDVIEALRHRIQNRGIRVECLFNDADEPLKILDLARDFPDNLAIWYLEDERPIPDIHYKIVDGGKLVHLSRHDHGSDEREYVLRNANKWWVTKGTHRRISRAYIDEFRRGIKDRRRASSSSR